MRPAAPRTDHTHVLLLRGINVGRSNRVGKDTLIRWAQAAGGEAVTTHLASGNVLFRASSDAAAEGVREGFARRAREEGGLDVPVVLVDVGTLDHGDDRPAGPDRTALEGRLLWTRCATGVADSPLTPARLDRALGVRGTARNLTTVRVLAGLPAGDRPRRTARGASGDVDTRGTPRAGRRLLRPPGGHVLRGCHDLVLCAAEFPGAENLTFMPADGSPSGSAPVIVTNEVSGSATVYEVNPVRGR